MEKKILVLNVFYPADDNISDCFFDLNGWAYAGAEGIRDENEEIDLEKIFGVSPLIEIIKHMTVILCQETADGKSLAVAIMRNAEINKYGYNYSWQFCHYNMSCKAEDAFIIPPEKRKFFKIKDYAFDDTKKTLEYAKKMMTAENCVKSDSTDIDARAAKASGFKDLLEISDEYYNIGMFDKISELWKKEYNRDRNNKDVIYQLAMAYMDCNKTEEARKLFESIFEYKKDNDCYLSRLAVLYFYSCYSDNAKTIADMIKDRSYLDDWGYPYDYIASYAPVHINTDNIMGNEIVKHKINLGFDDMPLPEVIEGRNGMKRFMDPIRKKGIPVTKEERVRQKVLRYLLDVCKIPEQLIISEDHMAHYDKNARIRADITVRNGDTTLLIIECKEPDIVIDGDPIRQLFGYNDIMKSRYLLLTNGRDSYIFQRNKEGKYESVFSMPDYETMLSEEGLKAVHISKSKLERPSITELKSKKIIKQYKDDGMYLGVNTSEKFAPFILNLMWGFLDTEYKAENISGYGVTIEKDNGTVDMKLTNASGGSFPGRYRQFIVRDRNGENVIVSFAVLGTWAESSTKGGYTSLVCGVDRTSMPIARLELRLDVCCDIGLFSTHLFHNGVRSRKKRQTTIDYVYSVCRKLIKDNKINLGTFSNNKLISMKDANVKDFILRLTSYVLLRDEMSQLNI